MRRAEVVVIGAGFAGLEVAHGLRQAPARVTVVDRNNFHTFQPLLYQVATAGLNAPDVAHPVRGVLRRQGNAAFRRATVTGVDWDARLLHCDRGEPLPFDHLVVAAGSSTSFFGVEGAAEHSFPLYTLADAVRLREHVLDRFESAAAQPDLVDDGALTVVVVGGGPTGVETAGALAELFSAVLRKDFGADLDVARRARVVLVEMGGSLLGAFSGGSQRYSARKLTERNVEVRLGAQVQRVEATQVTLTDGEVMPTHTLVWAAGVQANTLAGVLKVEQGRGGRIVVDEHLRVAGREGVWAIGDIAAIPGTGVAAGVLPQLAPVAMQSGRHVAAEICALLGAGADPGPFVYKDKGIMATIGRSAAVAELPLPLAGDSRPGLRLKGFPAWLAWLGLHLLYLLGNRNRASVLLNWGWSYATWDRGPRLILSPSSPSE